MRPPLELLLLMTCSVLVSILLASLARMISIEAGVFNQVTTADNDKAKEATKDYVKVIDDSPGELMWFVQVS